MVIREKMSLPIDARSCTDGQITKLVFNFGMITETPFKFQVINPITTSSSLHTTNPHSFKTMKGRLAGAIKTASRPPNQKVKANC